MKRLTLTLVFAVWTTLANAQQTYDVDIVMNHVATFAGSFVYNSAGTGDCSSAFCAPGVTPQFSKVFIHDPVSADGPSGPNAFTAAAGSGPNQTFFDTYFGTPGQSSYVYTLSFYMLNPLGSKKIGITDITFSTDANAFGTYSCGGPYQIANPPGEKCPVAKVQLAHVPEMSVGGSVAAVALLLGGLAVLRGRKLRP